MMRVMDIVEELRAAGSFNDATFTDKVMKRAADEIERLRRIEKRWKAVYDVMNNGAGE